QFDARGDLRSPRGANHFSFLNNHIFDMKRIYHLRIPRLPNLLIYLIGPALVVLFLYAGRSKLMDLHTFRVQMLTQPFPHWMAFVLTYTLPFLEIYLAGC